MTENTANAPTGWYDVDGVKRYWDGNQYLGNAALSSTATEAPDNASRAAEHQASSGPTDGSARACVVGWVIAGTSGLIVIGALMPWASLGFITVAGTSGDGAITIVLGLLATALGILRGLGKGVSGWWQRSIPAATLLAGALTACIAVYDMNRMLSSESTAFGSVAIGSGLWLTLIGGIALIGASIAGFVKK